MTRTEFCLTYYKFPALYSEHLEKLYALPNIRFVCGQLEKCPTTDRIHLQAYIEFKKDTSFKKIKECLPGVHVETRKGSRDEARGYCTQAVYKGKDKGKFAKEIELGQWVTQGQRTDLIEIKDMILGEDKRDMNEMIYHYGTSFHKIRYIEKLCEYRNKLPRNPDQPPVIHWYYGETGTGKTKQVYDKFEDIYAVQSYKWWDGYNQNETILIDDMRRDFCKFNKLLQLLDRYPHKVEMKGGMIEIHSPFIVITCPFHPQFLYQGEDIQQLLRRITHIQYFSNNGLTDDQLADIVRIESDELTKKYSTLTHS